MLLFEKCRWKKVIVIVIHKEFNVEGNKIS